MKSALLLQKTKRSLYDRCSLLWSTFLCLSKKHRRKTRRNDCLVCQSQPPFNMIEKQHVLYMLNGHCKRKCLEQEGGIAIQHRQVNQSRVLSS